MSFMNLRRRLPALALLSVIAAGGAVAQTGPVLTTEADLADPAKAAAIETFWTTRGRGASFTGQRGVRIATRAFVQADRAAEAGAIVIVSGRTETMLKYKELVHDLWRNGYSVYIHDHRGQGLSGREPETAAAPQKGHVHRFDDYVADLGSLITRQVLPKGHARHYLLAHSMGGAITARYLQSGAAGLAKFQAAALSSPMLQIQGLGGLPADVATCKVAAGLTAVGKGTSYVVGGGGYKAKPFDDNEYTQSATRYQRLLAQYKAVPQVQLGSPTHGWLARSCAAAEAARDDGGKVSLPTLVLVAGDDSIVHPDGPEQFCQTLRVARPDAGCGGGLGGPVTIEGARHEMFIERDDLREQALTQILAFFRSHRGN